MENEIRELKEAVVELTSAIDTLNETLQYNLGAAFSDQLSALITAVKKMRDS